MTTRGLHVRRRMKFFPEPSQAGDTIIEVLISISILALVLAVSYVSTSNSLHQGTNAANRLQGLSYAQQQVEIIKNAQINYPAAFTNSLYESSAPFCIDPAKANDSTQNFGFVDLSGGGSCPAASPYALSDSYGGGLFTVSTSWPNAGSNSQNKLQVFYRIPSTLTGGAGGTLVTLNADSTAITTGQSATLSWNSSSDITGCSSASPAGWTTDTATSGSQSVSPAATTSYTITCNSAGGPVTSNNITITVGSALPPPVVTATTTFTVTGNPNLSLDPILSIYADGVLISAPHTYTPSELTTKCPSYSTVLPANTGTYDSTEVCGQFTLTLSNVPTPSTITFDFENDATGVSPAPGCAKGVSGCAEDNNVIINSITIPGHTVTFKDYPDGSPGIVPEPPVGSTLPPYNLWLAWDGKGDFAVSP